ncbi:MAG TPA: AraC family transcriptional regulator [Rhizomicrobium sp.]|jgi:AraC family transcriptional regulator
MALDTEIMIRDYPPFHAMPRHMHDEASIGIVIGGGFEEHIGRAERRYTCGHIALVPAGVEHAQIFGADATRQIIFRPTENWLDYLVDDKAKPNESPHSHSFAFRQLGDRLVHEIHEPDSFSGIACEAILLEVVAQFGRDCVSARKPLRPPSWLLHARDLLHERTGGPLKMADIARAAGRHEVHVAREFRRYFGSSVGTYLRQLRIESAARLLAGSRIGISEIALECGFSSHSHLCREFKLRFGVTPAHYRASRSS